jgi:ribosomal protein S12 methylthiotransferase accessory factor
MSEEAAVTTLVDAEPPISYDGAEYRARKEFLTGTQRAMPPEATLARIRPHFPTVGITRLADITGLDRLGVPIWCSIRPDSSTLAVDSGKGATAVAAATSAAMEALERSVAETFEDVATVARYAEVAGEAAFGPDEHPRIAHAIWAADADYEWTAAWDLVADTARLVPHQLVGLPRHSRSLRQSWFAPSSNGLASGNHFPEALCAALYEVIERDATCCWQAAMDRGMQPLHIANETITQPVICGLLETLDAVGVAADLLWCPNEFGVPVFIGIVRDVEVPLVGSYKGYGCHLDPEIAMIRAVTEAVQARTLIIAGARDDIFRAQFRALRATSAIITQQFERLESVAAPEVPDASSATFHGDVATMLNRLVERGFERVVVRALPAEHLDVSVVRVFVPGLEGYRFPWIDTGSRADEFDPSPWIG